MATETSASAGEEKDGSQQCSDGSAPTTGEIDDGSLQQRVSIISVTDLTDNLEDYQVVDTRTSAKFNAGHIPGSLNMEWEDWTYRSPRKLWNKFGLGDPTQLSRVLDTPERLLQIHNLRRDKPVVVVGEPFAWGADGRMAWNFLFWGFSHVALLDGGYPMWVANERSIETGTATAGLALYITESKEEPPSHISLQHQRRATLEEVQQVVNKDDGEALSSSRPLLLDARTLGEFTGEKKMPNQRRPGRIPGSRLIPALQLYQSDGTFVSNEELEKILKSDTSSQVDTTIIAYCTAGIRSGLLVVLVEALLGVRMKNYDASIWEWASNPANPMETGPATNSLQEAGADNPCAKSELEKEVSKQVDA
jgi:3-mercaptopyruvate sulfurtransferase SseA